MATDQKELDAKILEMFNQFDFDKSNSIEEEELAKAMEAISPGISKEAVHQTFVALDLDKNNKLTLDEFKNFVYKSLTS